MPLPAQPRRPDLPGHGLGGRGGAEAHRHRDGAERPRRAGAGLLHLDTGDRAGLPRAASVSTAGRGRGRGCFAGCLEVRRSGRGGSARGSSRPDAPACSGVGVPEHDVAAGGQRDRQEEDDERRPAGPCARRPSGRPRRGGRLGAGTRVGAGRGGPGGARCGIRRAAWRARARRRERRRLGRCGRTRRRAPRAARTGAAGRRGRGPRPAPPRAARARAPGSSRGSAAASSSRRSSTSCSGLGCAGSRRAFWLSCSRRSVTAGALAGLGATHLDIARRA